MAFKKMTEYNDERYANFFLLRDDGDYARVIFLYTNIDDVLVADAHYINSADYIGYVHCCGRGCPACSAGIRVQKKLFIPLFNYDTGKIEFFDRNTRFEQQLQRQVFDVFPNPSMALFRITRHGNAYDVNTTYEITLEGKNTTPIEQILYQEGVRFPDVYERVIKEFSSPELAAMLNKKPVAGGSNDLPDYSVRPRTSTSAPTIPESAQTDPVEDLPDIPDDLPEFTIGGNATNESEVPDVSTEGLDEDVDF